MGAFYFKSIFMAERKITYKDASNKKKARDFLFSLFTQQQLNKIVGLAGPDVPDYIAFCRSKGYTEFEIFENHIPTVLEQIKYFRTQGKVHLTYGDILNTDANRNDVLFDLDYCVTARYMYSHLKKFNKNFIMTFARRITDKETFDAFFKAKGETLKSVLTLFTPLKHSILTTEEGNEYYYVEYRDTSNMCCFAKINH
jgi:hypothetical protein